MKKKYKRTIEYWKDVSKYKNILEVSNRGHVRYKYKNTNISENFVPKRYSRIRATLNGKRTTLEIHRLVALAFVKNPFKKPHVNHIDGNKQNNKSSNLEWVTPKENTYHGIKNGLIRVVGEDNPSSILKEKQIPIIKSLYLSGVSSENIGNMFKVHRRTISDVVNNKTWKHIKNKHGSKN